jgi:hypothetical protein
MEAMLPTRLSKSLYIFRNATHEVQLASGSTLRKIVNSDCVVMSISPRVCFEMSLSSIEVGQG